MSADRIFILGAGASRHSTKKLSVSMPLARDFFKSEFVNELWPMNYLKEEAFANSELVTTLSHYFSVKFTKYKKGKDYLVKIDSSVNIEEVFSFLEFILEGSYKEYNEKSVIEKSKKQLIFYLQNALDYFTTLDFDKSLYTKIINSLKAGDSIITYNWDLLIETCLESSKKGKVLLNSLAGLINPLNEITNSDYDKLAYTNLHKGYFLKMHGSINWSYCTNPNCTRHSIPFTFNYIDTIFMELWNCNFCGSALEPMILPPHLHKTYRKNRLYSLQANIAYQKLSTAKEIVVIGYSFPDFDFEANSIFRKCRMPYDMAKQGDQTFLERIVIVNPEVNNPQYLLKIEDIFGLKNSRKIYGQHVELKTFPSIESFLKKYTLT